MKAHARTRWWIAGAIGVLLIGVLVLGAVPVLTGRTSPPDTSHNAAWRAVVRARESGAQTWAGARLEEAEQTLYAGLTELRRQDVRLLFLRDYTAARDGLRRAEELAGNAADQALAARLAARDAARDALERAEEALGLALDLTSSIQMARQERMLLRASRLHLAEAKVLAREQEHDTAQRRATQAELEVRKVLEQLGSHAARFTSRESINLWRRWIDETIADSREDRSPAVVVSKEENRLTLIESGRPTRSWRADMGANSFSDKWWAGDGATPEGRYHIVSKKARGDSRFYMALLLDYPNREDLKRFKAASKQGRIPPGAHPGGLIEIHGEGGRGKDWTRGCVALSNAAIEELFERVPVGTPVTIVGGDGGEGRFLELANRHYGSAVKGGK